MWKARAEYIDGSGVERDFESDPYKNNDDEQYEIEEWLITRHEGCTWYSVEWLEDEE